MLPPLVVPHTGFYIIMWIYCQIIDSLGRLLISPAAGNLNTVSLVSHVFSFGNWCHSVSFFLSNITDMAPYVLLMCLDDIVSSTFSYIYFSYLYLWDKSSLLHGPILFHVVKNLAHFHESGLASISLWPVRFECFTVGREISCLTYLAISYIFDLAHILSFAFWQVTQ